MLQRHKRKLLIEEIRTRTAPLGHMTLLESMEMLKDALVKAEDAIVCITFTAKWCGPWRMIKPGMSLSRRISYDLMDVHTFIIDMMVIWSGRRLSHSQHIHGKSQKFAITIDLHFEERN